MSVVLDQIYRKLEDDIHRATFGLENEIYGEIYPFSFQKVLRLLRLSPEDHFCDVGSGFGKTVLQTALSSSVASATGIEIDNKRHEVALNAHTLLKQSGLPLRPTQFVCGDFITQPLDTVTALYVCSSAFSFELIGQIGEKINSLPNCQKVVSLRKIYHLDRFKLSNVTFVHTSWDRVACYLYERK